MARIANAAGKQCFIDESWLYKTDNLNNNTNVFADTIFRRDVFSFWQPLDARFMTLVYEIARNERISLVSFFWSNLFYGSLDYTPELDYLPYQELMRRLNFVAFLSIRARTPNVLGEHFRKLANQ